MVNKGLWSLVEWEVSLKEQVYQQYGKEKRKKEERYLERWEKKSLVECKYSFDLCMLSCMLVCCVITMSLGSDNGEGGKTLFLDRLS